MAKAPQNPAAWLFHGTAFHHAIEEYELSDRTITLEQAQEAYFAEYDRLVADELERTPDHSKWLTGGRKKAENDIADRRVKGSDQVEIYISYAEAHADEWRIYPVGPKGKAVELSFDISFGGVSVIGYIDQVREYRDGRIVPVDLKSGTKEPASGFQLAVYAQAINEYLGVLPQAGAFFMPKLRQNGTLVGDVWKDLSMWNRPMLDRMFQDFDKAERAQIYLPNPGDHCRTCAVFEFCSVNGVDEQKEQFLEVRKRRPREPQQDQG